MDRVGIGYDLHRMAPGRALMLGTVEIPHTFGLLGHSDGDVLAHAVADALLGASALGEIGTLFPDSDPRWKVLDDYLKAAEEKHLLKVKQQEQEDHDLFMKSLKKGEGTQ